MSDRPGVTVHRNLAVPAPKVVDVLLDAPAFPVWVVGVGRVTQVDDGWPAPGLGFTHETGKAPFKLRDRTILQDLDRDHGRVAVVARVWPAGEALVQIQVTPRSETSCRVTMHERPLAGPGSWLPQPLYRPALKLRNEVSLWRLERLARGRLAGV